MCGIPARTPAETTNTMPKTLLMTPDRLVSAIRCRAPAETYPYPNRQANDRSMNVATSRVYDANDQLIRDVTDDGFNLASVAYYYDINRMLALRVDARGGRTVLLYDEADQLVNKIDP